jgi:hypothetical protein
MEWFDQNDLDRSIFDAGKKAWAQTADELGNPRFLLNDQRGWHTVSLVPKNQVWSYIYDHNYQGNPKGPTGFLRFGTYSEAQYFLVFDEAWTGEVRDTVLSYRRTCKECKEQPGRSQLSNLQLGPCERCNGQREWIYPRSTRRQTIPIRDLPRDWREMNTTFAPEVLWDRRVPSEVLIVAAQRGNVKDRVVAAMHPGTPESFLNETLATDTESEVRNAVALRAHQGLTPDTIKNLCRDESDQVRSTMARHRVRVIGESACRAFVEDSSVLVRTRLAANLDVPNDIKVALLPGAGGAECKSIREVLAGNPAINANEKLRFLTRDFEDLFSVMFYELLARPDLTPETIRAIREHTPTEGGRLLSIVDSYESKRPKSRIEDSGISAHEEEFFPEDFFDEDI